MGGPQHSSITSRQREVLEVILDGLQKHGAPPTLREIRDRLGLRSVGAVQDHVRALKRKGIVQRRGRTARGLFVVSSASSTPVPILGTVPAGTPLEAIEAAEGWLSVPGTQRSDFALKIKGNSMNGAAIIDGDFVIVEKTAHLAHGDIVVALIDGEATVKRLDLSGEFPTLIAANPEYSPIHLLNEDWRLIGRVVGLWRNTPKAPIGTTG